MNASTLSSNTNQTLLTFKIVVIGDKSVGKTSIVQRYIEKSFSNQTKATVGAYFFSQILFVQLQQQGEKQPVKLQIWDTAGEEKFRSLTPMYYKNASAVCLVYDQTSEESFDSLQKWIKEIDEHRTNPVLLAVIANKVDITDKEEVSIKKGIEFAKKIKAFFIQTSAKENIGIDDLFKLTAEKLYLKYLQGEDQSTIEDGSKKEAFKLQKKKRRKSNKKKKNGCKC